VRWNASKGFLRPVRHRANLEVWTGAQITRLLQTRGGGGTEPTLRITGVEMLRGADRVEARLAPGGEVLMCTGAVGTPQLLQLSGIGPAEVLHGHGIAVAHALPGVGENLQDHLQIRAVFGVEGVKTLQIDGHVQDVTVRGWLRSNDVRPGNTIESWRVADAEIVYGSNETLGKTDDGIWAKIFKWIIP